MFFSYIEINNAAREGASYAATNPTDSATIQARMLQETNAQAQKGAGALAAPVVTCHDTTGAVMSCTTAAGGAGAGNTVTVSASEPFTFLTPFINGFFNNSFTMSASATSAVLQYGGQIGGTPPGGCSAPVASFTVVVNGTIVTTDPSASTPNSGVCNISGYNWDWGDGTTDVGTASSTTHTYVANSNYWITLTVTNQGGTNSLTEEVTIGTPPPPTCAKPTANFTYTVDKKTYSYTDTSTVADPVNCPITAWYWTFDDGTHSNAQNPTYTYGNASAHTATLQVTNAGGTSTVGPK